MQGPVKLTVLYQDQDGNEVFDDQVFIHSSGDSYYVVAPQLPGYDMSVEVIRGTIENDMTVTVKYTPKVYQLTVNYIFTSGAKATGTYSEIIRTGESYLVESPEIPGYRALRARVSGENPGRNEAYTVIYVPADQEDYTTIEDYETPLNPGYTDLQIGVCAE